MWLNAAGNVGDKQKAGESETAKQKKQPKDNGKIKVKKQKVESTLSRKGRIDGRQARVGERVGHVVDIAQCFFPASERAPIVE